MDTADLLYVLAGILAVGIATALLVAWLAVRRKHHRHRKISEAKRREHTKHNLIEAEDAPEQSRRSRSRRRRRQRSGPKIDLFNNSKQDDEPQEDSKHKPVEQPE